MSVRMFGSYRMGSNPTVNYRLIELCRCQRGGALRWSASSPCIESLHRVLAVVNSTVLSPSVVKKINLIDCLWYRFTPIIDPISCTGARSWHRLHPARSSCCLAYSVASEPVVAVARPMGRMCQRPRPRSLLARLRHQRLKPNSTKQRQG